MYGQLPFPPKIQVPSAIASQSWPRLLINDFVIAAGAIHGCKAGTWQDQNSYIGQLPFPGVYEPLLNLLQTHLSFSKDKKIALAPSTRNSPTSIKMHFLAPILATFTTLTTLVSASGFTDPVWSMVTRNQSALFGYQLLGSQFFNTSAVCNNISIASHGLWNGQIDDTYVERIMPCVVSFSIVAELIGSSQGLSVTRSARTRATGSISMISSCRTSGSSARGLS
jgi:hypothetical protein